MKRKSHSYGYYKQARQHWKKLRLSGQSCYQTPKVYVYKIPGTLFYTAKPKFEGAKRERLFIAAERLFIAADGDRSNKLLLTETDMMKLWDTFWQKSMEHPDKSCASIYDRSVKRLEQIKQDFSNSFHRCQQKVDHPEILFDAGEITVLHCELEYQ